jgi:hypothetical protein
MSRVLALLRLGDCLKFDYSRPSHLTRVPRPDILGDATDFVKGALIGGIVVVFVWLALG